MEGRKRGRYPETRNDEREEVRTNARSAKRRREGGTRREEDPGGGEKATGAKGARKGARESASRGASTVEGTSGRARSGGNSAINTNIFRSVLQPCFDNHPLQRALACPLRHAIPAGRPPRNLARFFPPYPARVSSPSAPSPLYASHPPDLKYMDTLTHTPINEHPARGRASHPLFASSAGYYPRSSVLYILGLLFYSL